MELIDEDSFFDLAMEMGFPYTQQRVYVTVGDIKLWADMVRWNREKYWMDQLERQRWAKMLYGNVAVQNPYAGLIITDHVPI